MGPCEYVSRANGHDVDSVRAESNFTVLQIPSIAVATDAIGWK